MTTTLNIIIDGSQLDQTASSIADALEIATDSFTDADRIITDATLDDLPLSSGQLTEPSEDEIGGTLTITTGSARATLADAICAGLTEIDALKELHALRADELAEGRTHKAILGLKDIVTTWQQIEQLISFCAVQLTVPIDDTEDQTASMLASLCTDLKELSRTIADEDYSALADCLVFDLQARADECKHWLETVASELPAPSA